MFLYKQLYDYAANSVRFATSPKTLGPTVGAFITLIFIAALCSATVQDGGDVLFSLNVLLVGGFSIYLFFLLLLVVDSVIQRLVSLITHGDIDVRTWCYSKLTGHDKIRHLDAAYQSLVLVTLGLFCSAMFTLFVPYGVVVMSVLGCVVGIVFLARYAYGVNKRFNTHRTDPNAHKSTEDK